MVYDTVRKGHSILRSQAVLSVLVVVFVHLPNAHGEPHGKERGERSIRSFHSYDKWYYAGEAVPHTLGGRFCDAQYCADGEGTLRSDGSWTYTGEFVSGQIEGFGRIEGDFYEYVGGFKAEASWARQASMLWGASFEGQFVEGRMVGDFVVGPNPKVIRHSTAWNKVITHSTAWKLIGLVLGRLHDDEGRAGDQVMRLEDAIG